MTGKKAHQEESKWRTRLHEIIFEADTKEGKAFDTVLGQSLASMLMIIGYAIIAVPTGIMSVEIIRAETGAINTQVCNNCNCSHHADDAKYCKICGEKL